MITGASDVALWTVRTLAAGTSDGVPQAVDWAVESGDPSFE
jgi:hypothetical protein